MLSTAPLVPSLQRLLRGSLLALAVAAALCVLLARAQPARAAGVVGSGTPASCTETALDAALLGGGSVSFACGANPATITITLGHKVISQTTTIDGGELITLHAYGSNLFLVPAGQALTLTGITLTNDISQGSGGCIDVEGGSLLLMNSALIACRANIDYGSNFPYTHGGGIFNQNGVVTIISSSLLANVAAGGGAVENSGTGSLIISNTVISYNSTSNLGGAIYNFGIITATSTRINSNTAYVYHGGFGGGIYNYGTVTLDNSDVSDNYVGEGDGGGILNYGTLTLNNSTVNRNYGLYWGGAGIANAGTATLNNSSLTGNFSWGVGTAIRSYGTLVLNSSTISNNTSLSDGGGIAAGGSAVINNSTFSGNKAAVGGGIYNFGSMTLDNSTVSGNVATYAGGGGILNEGTATLTNSTISGNSANWTGGGISSTNTLSLTNVTLSGNSAKAGGGIAYLSGTLSLRNSIIANSPAGGNCFGGSLPAQNSISSDNSCGFAGPYNHTNVDPLLTVLGNFGGPTLVHMLKPDSPAINAVIGHDAPPFDQRGVSRPQDGRFDIGAVERAPHDFELPLRLFLPLLLRPHPAPHF